MWALDIPPDQFLGDDKTKLATYKAFQEMIEAWVLKRSGC